MSQHKTGGSAWLCFVLGALVIVVLDQFTKQLAVDYFADQPQATVPVLGDFVRFVLVHNRGASFGILQGQQTLFIVASLLVIPVLFYFYATANPRQLLLRVALTLMLCGNIGNLIDRARQGYVVDFIDVGLDALRWPVFNVADSSFVVGTIALIAWMLFFDTSQSKSAPAAE